jgi:hypothetical protein
MVLGLSCVQFETYALDMADANALLTRLSLDSLGKVAYEIRYLGYFHRYFLIFETHFFTGATISTLSPTSC